MIICIAVVNTTDLQCCLAQLSWHTDAVVRPNVHTFSNVMCLCCVFYNSLIFFGYHFTAINSVGAMWHYLLTSSCRQSIDVSMIAKARKRVRSAHGSPLSDTTSSPSCTPARKAWPPSSTCGRHNLHKRTKKQNLITNWVSVLYLHK